VGLYKEAELAKYLNLVKHKTLHTTGRALCNQSAKIKANELETTVSKRSHYCR